MRLSLAQKAENMRILQKVDESCNDSDPTKAVGASAHNERVQSAVRNDNNDDDDDDGLGAFNDNNNNDDDDDDNDNNDDASASDSDDDDDEDDGPPLTQEERVLIQNETRLNQFLAKR